MTLWEPREAVSADGRGAAPITGLTNITDHMSTGFRDAATPPPLEQGCCVQAKQKGGCRRDMLIRNGMKNTHGHAPT